jgi:hypothetical protein
MTVALVFVMSGAAFAAHKYLIVSIKQIKPSVVSQLKGKAGANGKDGAQGAPGEKGAPGPTGEKGLPGGNGTDGKDGVSVTSKALSKGNANCSEGGSEFAAAENKKTYACNGSPWTAGGTLPKGASEYGMWVAVASAGIGAEGVGFNIPLASAPSVHYINANKMELTPTGEQVSTVCTGSAASPTAPTSTLCVYAHIETEVSTEASFNEFFWGAGVWKWGIIVDTEGGEGGGGVVPNTATPFGFDISGLGKGGEAFKANGSWAVTG